MNDYRWFDFATAPLHERFPASWTWLAGAQQWATGASQLAFTDPDAARRWLNNIRRAPAKPKPCPRVFVSHRQADQDAALRVAWLAWGKGFDYWLDIVNLNPAHNQQIKMLETSLGRPLTPFEKSVLLAAMIEMALLNCTHVIAVMTLQTAGSQWVPYEYGRMKDTSLLNKHTACWWDTTSLPQTDLPEYVHLAGVHEKENDILAWFSNELSFFKSCSGAPRGVWAGSTPKVLPTG